MISLCMYSQRTSKRRNQDLLYGYRPQVWQNILLSAGQSMTLKTTRTAGGKDHCRVEIEKATIDEGNGKLSNELAGNLNPG